MKIYLINHSWESYMRTKEYCGFMSEEERDQISVGDKVVYFGQGIVFGVFEAIELVNDEFNGWKKKYPYQIKLKEIMVINNGVLARQLQDKFKILKEDNKYNNLVELSDDEFKIIIQSINENKKEVFLE